MLGLHGYHAVAAVQLSDQLGPPYLKPFHLLWHSHLLGSLTMTELGSVLYSGSLHPFPQKSGYSRATPWRCQYWSGSVEQSDASMGLPVHAWSWAACMHSGPSLFMSLRRQ